MNRGLLSRSNKPIISVSKEKGFLFFLFIFLFFTSSLNAQSPEFIEETFKIHPGYLYLADFDSFGETTDPDKDPLPKRGKLPKDLEEKTFLYLLDEAAWVLSGTIFGFRFDYQPSDKKRGIKEEFTLTPIGSIQRGNKRLRVLESGYTENNEEIYIRIRYTYSEAEKRRMELWSSTLFPAAGGTGGVPFYTEQSDKEAVKEAIKEAVRNHLRPLVRNRPGKVTGTVALRSPPVIYYNAGSCISRVSVVLQYDKIEHNRFPEDIRQ